MAAALVLVLIGGLVMVLRAATGAQPHEHRRVLRQQPTASTTATTSSCSACQVGKIEKIEPQPDGVKVSFWVDDRYKFLPMPRR